MFKATDRVLFAEKQIHNNTSLMRAASIQSVDNERQNAVIFIDGDEVPKTVSLASLRAGSDIDEFNRSFNNQVIDGMRRQ